MKNIQKNIDYTSTKKIEKPFRWDLHENSNTTSLWPVNLFTGVLNSDIFHRNREFSVLRGWGTKIVTRPFPKG